MCQRSGMTPDPADGQNHKSAMTCRCDDITELWDDDAKVYADEHLERVETRADGWEVLYRCVVSQRTWLEDYPRSEEHGGGPMRLRRLD
jgi:hypothetical protein